MGLDPQVKAILEVFDRVSGGQSLADMTTEQARAVFSQLREMRSGPPEPVGSVADHTLAGPGSELKIRAYAPATGQPPYPVMVFFHGGGFVIGDLESHDPLCRALANASGSMIVAVDYRLAPEHKFPAAVDDSYAATEWIAGHVASLGGDPERLGVGGDSAGGTLAAVVSLLSRDRGGPRIAYQLLLYPGVDWRMDFPSVRENAEGYFLTLKDMVWFGNHYIRTEADKLDPLASPLLAADHSGLPPALIVTAEFDPLRDEGEAYAETLRRAGVAVKVMRYDGMIHGFLSLAGVVVRAQQAIDEIGREVRRLAEGRAATVS